MLYADGSVRFVTTPMGGPQEDNIYTYRSSARQKGDQILSEIKSGGFAGSPVDGVDSVLLPTAEQLGQERRPVPTEDEVRADGEAARNGRNGGMRLEQIEAEIRGANLMISQLPDAFAKQALLMKGLAATLDDFAEESSDKGDAATAARAAAGGRRGAGGGRPGSERPPTLSTGATSRPAK